MGNTPKIMTSVDIDYCKQHQPMSTIQPKPTNTVEDSNTISKKFRAFFDTKPEIESFSFEVTLKEHDHFIVEISRESIHLNYSVCSQVKKDIKYMIQSGLFLSMETTPDKRNSFFEKIQKLYEVALHSEKKGKIFLNKRKAS